MKMRFVLAILLVAALPAVARATLVVKPTFDQLVDRADLIFEGEVVDVRSRWAEGRDGRVIVSDVTFRVTRTLKGTSSSQVVLEFFGGTVGKHAMEVAGMPAFARGDRDILFVRQDARAGYPLVGLMHGRFRVKRSAVGADMVTTFDGRAIGDVARTGSDSATPRATGRGATVEEFSNAVTTRVATRRGGGMGARP